MGSQDTPRRHWVSLRENTPSGFGYRFRDERGHLGAPAAGARSAPSVRLEEVHLHADLVGFTGGESQPVQCALEAFVEVDSRLGGECTTAVANEE
jgi:hypothetical protein